MLESPELALEWIKNGSNFFIHSADIQLFQQKLADDLLWIKQNSSLVEVLRKEEMGKKQKRKDGFDI